MSGDGNFRLVREMNGNKDPDDVALADGNGYFVRWADFEDYLKVVMCMAWLQAKSQAKQKVLAWSWLWPGLDFLKAKANGPGHSFEHYFLKQLPPIISTNINFPHVSNCS